MTLHEARQNIGKKVLYTPYAECTSSILEIGVIIRVSNQYVGVRYGTQLQVKSTRARDIKLIEEVTK